MRWKSQRMSEERDRRWSRRPASLCLRLPLGAYASLDHPPKEQLVSEFVAFSNWTITSDLYAKLNADYVLLCLRERQTILIQ